MKKYIIIISLLISTLLLTLFLSNYKENNKEISKVERLLSKPEGIQAFTLNGQKTNITFNELINSYIINKITCKNGSSATYNKEDNSISLSNIHMPDYCTIDFTNAPAFYDKLLADNPTIKTRTDFNTTFTETNTGTLYKATESIAGSTPKDVYYFAGDAKNNWVKFAGFYWRIIRTNHDGSIRLLYSGTRPDTTEGYIGESKFNSTSNDSMYVGYMYGTSGSQVNNRANTNNSTIKTYIDNWYSTNLSSYSKYISTEAVYCNDREVGSGTYSATGSKFYYAAYTRLYTNKTPTYNCTNIKDAFSGSNSEAKLIYPIGLMTADEITYAGGKSWTNLPSPYAWHYLNSVGGSITGSTWWWSLSSLYWSGDGSNVWIVRGSGDPGGLNGVFVDNSIGARPAISLKACALWTSGNGAPETPYEISTTSGC